MSELVCTGGMHWFLSIFCANRFQVIVVEKLLFWLNQRRFSRWLSPFLLLYERRWKYECCRRTSGSTWMPYSFCYGKRKPWWWCCDVGATMQIRGSAGDLVKIVVWQYYWILYSKVRMNATFADDFGDSSALSHKFGRHQTRFAHLCSVHPL